MVMTRCSKCHGLYTQGTYCPKCNKHNQRYNKTRGPETRFYTSKAWKKVKADVINYYNNVDIYMLGLVERLIPSSRPLVHHIIPYKERESLALDFDNLAPMSTASHNLVHELYDSGRREEAIATINKGKKLFEELKNGNKKTKP